MASRSTLLLAAFSTLMLMLVALTARAADAPPFKVGYVDMQSALVQTDEGKRELAKMKKDFDVKQTKLDTLQADLKKLKDDFDKQAAMLNADAKAKKQAELQAKFMQVQQTYANMQTELGEKQQGVTKGIFQKMKAIIDKIGDREGYTLILDRTENNVLYYKRHMDVTDEVVRAFNAQNK
jgi:outer membrane protein